MGQELPSVVKKVPRMVTEVFRSVQSVSRVRKSKSASQRKRTMSHTFRNPVEFPCRRTTGCAGSPYLLQGTLAERATAGHASELPGTSEQLGTLGRLTFLGGVPWVLEAGTNTQMLGALPYRVCV